MPYGPASSWVHDVGAPSEPTLRRYLRKAKGRWNRNPGAGCDGDHVRCAMGRGAAKG